jgi:predicted alpha/beta superfamily hydrolase
MGGLISLFGALSRPDVFGFAGVFSPSLWWADEAVFPWAEELPAGQHVRVYLDMGDREGTTLDVARETVARAERMAVLLRRKGHQVRFRVASGGRHSEDAWARRFPEALGFFLHAPE